MISWLLTLHASRLRRTAARAVFAPDKAGQAVTCTLKDGSAHLVSCSHVLLATGSTPLRPAEVPFDDVRVFDSDSIAKLAFLPRKGVVIAGAGIIAIEYAKIFSKMHCRVTMLVRGEAKSSLARIGLDEAIAQGLLDDLAEHNIRVLTNTSAGSFGAADDGSLVITLKAGKEGSEPPAPLSCDVFLAAMGRKACASGVGLAELASAALDAKSGVVLVDDDFKVGAVADPGSVYAVGDVVGPPYATLPTAPPAAPRAAVAVCRAAARRACAL